MHFRAAKKSASDISLSDSIDTDPDGNGLSFLDTLADDRDMAERVESTELISLLRREMHDTLDGREKEILTLRYGLNGETPLTQREIAQRQGISRSYVSRLEKKALEKLKRKLEKE